MPARALSTVRLVNGSTGDPVLYLDYPGKGNALLFDGGENCGLTRPQLADLEAVFVTHHHIDHFIGLDRIVRANLDGDKTLRVFGPAGTIDKVFGRVTGYDHPFFPFMKLRLELHELLPGVERVGTLECQKKFARPEVSERPRTGRVCYETAELAVEAVAVDHTVPCLAYALATKSGERVAYVTDTLWSDAVRPELVRLAKGAKTLYCDSFYAAAQAKDAAKHKHMTAPQAGELARLAKVDQLVLIHFSTRYAGKYDQLIAEAAAVFPKVSAEL